MKLGNWIPMPKASVKDLPRDRPYTRLEALFSLQVDYDASKAVTLTGYSSLWRWSKGKVSRFLNEIGVKIEYPEDTRGRQNQRGLIVCLIPERKRTDNGTIRLIDSKWLGVAPERKRDDNGLITERSRVTTIDPNPNPDKTTTAEPDGPAPFDGPPLPPDDGPPLPPDNPPPQPTEHQHYEKVVGDHFKAIKAAADKFESMLKSGEIKTNGTRFNVHQLIQKFVNEKKHPGAIAYAIDGIAKPYLWEDPKFQPWAYVVQILKTKNGTFNERDAIAIHEEMKKIEPGALKDLTFGLFKVN